MNFSRSLNAKLLKTIFIQHLFNLYNPNLINNFVFCIYTLRYFMNINCSSNCFIKLCIETYGNISPGILTFLHVSNFEVLAQIICNKGSLLASIMSQYHLHYHYKYKLLFICIIIVSMRYKLICFLTKVQGGHCYSDARNNLNGIKETIIAPEIGYSFQDHLMASCARHSFLLYLISVFYKKYAEVCIRNKRNNVLLSSLMSTLSMINQILKDFSDSVLEMQRVHTGMKSN